MDNLTVDQLNAIQIMFWAKKNGAPVSVAEVTWAQGVYARSGWPLGGSI